MPARTQLSHVRSGAMLFGMWNMPRRTWLVLLSCLIGASGHAADLGIAPSRIEVTGEPGTVVIASATVVTSSKHAQQIAVDLSDWTMGLSGSLTYMPSSTVAASAAPWLTVGSDVFEIAPGGSVDVAIAAQIPHDADGTHHAMVLFAVIPAARGNANVGVTTTTRIGLTVYVTVAGTERDGSELIDMYQGDHHSLTAVILNTGNTVMRLGGVVEIRDEAGGVVHRLNVPDVPVLRESERELTFALPEDLESGFYVALALIEDSRGGVLAGELPFDVP